MEVQPNSWDAVHGLEEKGEGTLSWRADFEYAQKMTGKAGAVGHRWRYSALGPKVVSNTWNNVTLQNFNSVWKCVLTNFMLIALKRMVGTVRASKRLSYVLEVWTTSFYCNHSDVVGWTVEVNENDSIFISWIPVYDSVFNVCWGPFQHRCWWFQYSIRWQLLIEFIDFQYLNVAWTGTNRHLVHNARSEVFRNMAVHMKYIEMNVTCIPMRGGLSPPWRRWV